MGALCSKKNKAKGPMSGGPAESNYTVNINEPPSNASMWKRRITGDGEELNIDSGGSANQSTAATNSNVPLTSTTSLPNLNENPTDKRESERSLRSGTTGDDTSKKSRTSLKKRSRTSIKKKRRHSRRNTSSKSKLNPQSSTPAPAAKQTRSKYTGPGLSLSRLTFDPRAPGPTIIELGKDLDPGPPPDRNQSLKCFPRVLPNTGSRKPGSRLIKKAQAKYKVAEEGRASSLPAPEVKKLGRSKSGKRSKGATSGIGTLLGRASVATSRRKWKKRKNGKSVTSVVTHLGPWNKFPTSLRPPRAHAKENPDRADNLYDPRFIAQIEFETRNRRIMRGLVSDWENQNGGAESSSGCCPRAPPCAANENEAPTPMVCPAEIVNEILDNLNFNSQISDPCSSKTCSSSCP